MSRKAPSTNPSATSRRTVATKHELAAAADLHKRRHKNETGRLPLPEGAHPESFGLTMSGNCLAPRASHGQVMIVEPIRPEPGEIAVFWFKGQDMPAAKILRTDLKMTGFPVHPKSEVVPIIEFEQINPPRRYAVDGGTLEECFRVHSVIDRAT